MQTETVVIRCAQCRTRNRVPKQRLGDRPVCGKCQAPLPTHVVYDKPVVVTDTTFQQEIGAFDGVAVLDIWAPWCGPCQMVGPMLEQLAAEWAGQIKIGKLDMDQNPITPSQFAVQSVPTLLFFKQGKLVQTLIGAQPKANVAKVIQSLASSG